MSKKLRRVIIFLAVAIVTVLLISFLTFAIQFHRRLEAHRKLYAQIENSLRKIYFKKPKEFSKGEWDFIISNTKNAFGNCLVFPEYIVDEPRFKRFVQEIEVKSNKAIDVEVIDWIWDEIEAMSKNGPSYSTYWRPTKLGGLLREAESISEEPF